MFFTTAVASRKRYARHCRLLLERLSFIIINPPGTVGQCGSVTDDENRPTHARRCRDYTTSGFRSWRAQISTARPRDFRDRKLRYAASRHSYRWCSPPTRGSATTIAAGDGRGVMALAFGVSLLSPKWQRSSW